MSPEFSELLNTFMLFLIAVLTALTAHNSRKTRAVAAKTLEISKQTQMIKATKHNPPLVHADIKTKVLGTRR